MATIAGPGSEYTVQIEDGDQDGSQSMIVSDQAGNVVGSADVQSADSGSSVSIEDGSGAVIAQVSYGETGSLSVSLANESGILTPVLDIPAAGSSDFLSSFSQVQMLLLECGQLDVDFLEKMVSFYRADVKDASAENLNNATEALNKQQQASKGGNIAKAFGWIATVVAVVAAVAMSVATFGAASPAAAMLIGAATLMLANQISAETGGWMQKGMTAMCGGNEMAGMIVLMVVITALSLGGAGAGAMAAKAGAKAAEAAAKGAGTTASAATKVGATAAEAAKAAATAAVRSWGDDAVRIAQQTVDDALGAGMTAGQAAEKAVMQAYSNVIASRIASVTTYGTYAQLGSGVLATGAKIPSDIQQYRLQQAMHDLSISQTDLEKMRKFFALVQKSLSEAMAGNMDAFESLMKAVKDLHAASEKSITAF